MKDSILTIIIWIIAFISVLFNMYSEKRITDLESENYRLKEEIVELKERNYGNRNWGVC